MGHNYESDFKPPEQVGISQELLPTWNTWTTRSILKSLAGLFLALPIFSLVLGFASSGTALGSLAVGIILWAVFYQMEMEYRKLTPDRIR